MKTPKILRLSGLLAFATALIAPLTLSAQTPTAPTSLFNLTGFGQATTGGGVIPETDAAYRKVYNATDFAKAIYDATKNADGKPNSVKVIEVMSDLDLGYNEVGGATFSATYGQFRAAATPQLHPKLITTGVSIIDISIKGSGLTIFSNNGSAIRHCKLNIKGCSNIIIRNLRFEELWEWDEQTKGDYDKNDWDFITLGDGGGTVSNIWIDHCTFTKAYDGCIDMKAPTQNITVSWCKIVGDDSTNIDFVRQQMDGLEANKSSYAFYNFLRTHGFSEEQIIQTVKGTDKTSLMGATSLQSKNNDISATYHHIQLNNVWDRSVPRLRGGNVHVYNIVADATDAMAAKKIRDSIVATYDAATLKSFGAYNFNPPLNGCISTEGGALLLEKSVYTNVLWPLRNNQTDVTQSKYTGKIEGRDVIYNMAAMSVSGSTVIIGGRTTTRGNSTDAGSQLGPKQAAIIPFSWNSNSTTSGGVLPYTVAYMDDPSTLPVILDANAGAKTITWNDADGKLNWLKTTYAGALPDAPVSITVQPQSQAAVAGGDVTFTVAASGSPLIQYQWYKDGTPITGATTAILTLTNVSSADVGSYYVHVSNDIPSSVDSSTAAFSIAIPPLAPVALAASGTTGTGFTANWNAALNATGYSIDISGDSSFATCWPGYDNLAVGSGTSYTVTGLNAATTYYYRVRATVGTSYSSGNSAPIAVATQGASSTTPNLVNDLFNDTDRINGQSGNATTSASPSVATPTATNTQWVANRVKKLVASPLGMKWDFDTTSNVMAIGYMQPFTVDVNKPVTMTLKFTVSGSNSSAAAAETMRIALFNDTANGRIVNDGFGSTDTKYTGDVGYAIITSSNVGSDLKTDVTFNTCKRLDSPAYPTDLLSKSADWPILGTSAGTGYIEPNIGYIVQFVLTYDGTAMTIRTRITGGNLGSIDYISTDNSATIVRTFNALAVRFGKGTGQYSGINFDSLTVSDIPDTPVLPIPAIYSAATASGKQSQAFSYSIAATNAATLYAATNLPAGVTCNPNTGVISGTPAENGLFNATLTATNANGISANFSLMITVDAPDILPNTPVAVAATDSTTTGFTANWNAASGATGYTLDVSTDSSFASYVTNYQDMDAGGVTSWTFNDLTAGTTYYYRVNAYNDTGVSAVSNVITAITANVPIPPAAPTSSDATSVTADGFTANWAAVTGATSYVIDVATDSGFSTILSSYNNLSISSGTSFAVTGLNANTTYYYRIRAINANGASANSGTVTIMTVSGGGATVSTILLNDSFADGSRLNQSLPDSANWWTSAGSSNFTAVVGAATHTISSARTIVGYFTNSSDTPVTLASGESLQLDFTCQFTGFDTAATGANFYIGLLRSVANPTATTDATNGFTVVGTAGSNTNARIAGDFGSGAPPSGVYSVYTGYMVTSKMRGLADDAPLAFQARTGNAAALFTTSAAWAPITADNPADTALITSTATDYKGTLMISRGTDSSVMLTYKLIKLSDSTVAMQHSATVPASQAAYLFTDFDTVAFYAGKAGSSAAYSLVLKNIAVTKSVVTPPPPPAVPVITSSTTASAIVGTAFIYTITGSNSPTSYAATGLPSSLTLDTASGVISGTPVLADIGTSTVILTASNAVGTSLPVTLALTISAGTPAAPVINSATTATATQGSTFSYQMTASNTPTSYSATGLPAGLACDMGTGLISGTPTASGTFNVLLTATNAGGTSPAVTLVITVNASAPVVVVPVITSITTATATQGTPFSYVITATSTVPMTYAATGLPVGLSIDAATGVIYGTPTTAGTYNVTISATNSAGTTTATLVITANAGSGGGAPTIVISDTFGDFDRIGGTDGSNTTKNSPLVNAPTVTNSQWVVSNLSGMKATGTGNDWTQSGTSALVALGYFPSVTVASGQTTTFQVQFVTGTAGTLTNNLRFGLLNDGALRRMTDGFSATDAAFVDDTGYAVFSGASNIGGGSTTDVSFNTFKRRSAATLSVSGSNLFGTGSDWGDVSNSSTIPIASSGSNATGYFAASSTYTLTFQVANSGSSVDIRTQMTGGNLSGYDYVASDTSATAVTTFNTIALRFGGAANQFSDINVTALNVTTTASGSSTPAPAVPAIIGALTATATQGAVFTYTVTATNTPIGYAAIGLPDGLTINNTTGVISGTATAAGIYNVTLTASNAGGTSVPATLVLTVNAAAGAAPAITSSLTATAMVGTAFTYNITASNTPMSYGATGLAAGLTFNSTTGAITGTPTSAGTFNVGLTATNAGGSGTATLVLTVNPSTPSGSAPVITSATTATATQGTAFTYQIVASNGPTSYAATGVPAGLTLDVNSGIISGTPTVNGSYNVSLTASNASGTSVAVILALTVNNPTPPSVPVITSATTAAGAVSTAFSYTITASNTPTSYTVTGTLPSGLTLNATTGVISGTPTAAGSYPVSLTATNDGGTSVAVTLTITITVLPPPPVITSLTTASGMVGVPFSYTIGISNLPATLTVTSVTLPPGIKATSGTAIFTGTPTATGIYTITFTVSNAGGSTTGTLTITIEGQTSLTLLAGVPGQAGFLNGPSNVANFNMPSAAAVDKAGNIYIADTANNIIRWIAPSGMVGTFAGATGQAGTADGASDVARFNAPGALIIDATANALYIADTGNNSIRKIDIATGVVSTIAGYSGSVGSNDGIGNVARFNAPSGIAIDGSGNLYIADTGNNTIRKINATTKAVTTIAGSVGSTGSADGTGTSARFDMPTGIAIDASGTHLYIADTGNSTIRSLTLSSGSVETISGATSTPGGAIYNTPEAIAVDAVGNIYVADTGNNVIRKIDSATHAVTTLAGSVGVAGSHDGLGTQSQLNAPAGITIDSNGEIYILDTGNQSVRVLQMGPRIISLSAGQTVNIGDKVTLSVIATGAPAPTYQWSRSGAAVVGGTNATLTLSSVYAGDAGDYTVTATNPMGTARSGTATLTVNQPGSGGGSSGSGNNSGGGGGALGWYYLCAIAVLFAVRRLRSKGEKDKN